LIERRQRKQETEFARNMKCYGEAVIGNNNNNNNSIRSGLRRKKKAKNPTAGNDVISTSKTRGNEICPKSKKSLLRRGGRKLCFRSRARGKFSIERASLVSPCLQ
jgi:hypothetical protein